MHRARHGLSAGPRQHLALRRAVQVISALAEGSVGAPRGRWVAAGRRAGNDRNGLRIRALIAVLWRAGLRISEALALAETDVDQHRGALLIRHAKGDKRREVGMDVWGFEHLNLCGRSSRVSPPRWGKSSCAWLVRVAQLRERVDADHCCACPTHSAGCPGCSNKPDRDRGGVGHPQPAVCGSAAGGLPCGQLPRVAADRDRDRCRSDGRRARSRRAASVPLLAMTLGVVILLSAVWLQSERSAGMRRRAAERRARGSRRETRATTRTRSVPHRSRARVRLGSSPRLG